MCFPFTSVMFNQMFWRRWYIDFGWINPSQSSLEVWIFQAEFFFGGGFWKWLDTQNYSNYFIGKKEKTTIKFGGTLRLLDNCCSLRRLHSCLPFWSSARLCSKNMSWLRFAMFLVNSFWWCTWHMGSLGYGLHSSLFITDISDFPTKKNHRIADCFGHVCWTFQCISGWWFQPLWKIWKSVGMIIPNRWKNVPNHQPDFIWLKQIARSDFMKILPRWSQFAAHSTEAQLSSS